MRFPALRLPQRVSIADCQRWTPHSATLNADREMQSIVFGLLQQRFEGWEVETRREIMAHLREIRPT
jgi:hypothetical protein